MTLARLSLVLILLATCSNAVAQRNYADLKAWDGQYPTYNKSPRKFFDLPEVRDPLRKLLPRRVYFLLTKGHTKEGPIKIVRNYLKANVCGSPESYSCDHITTLAIDLDDGSMYVAFDVHSGHPKHFATKAKFTDLPKDIRNEIEL